MNIFLSKSFLKSYKKLIKPNSPLKEKIKEKLALYQSDPNNPQLKLYKLKGKYVEDWSMAIESDIRLLFTYVKDGILLVDIGSHDEVYR